MWLFGQIPYICVSFLCVQVKSQLTTCVNAHCFQISIWTWFMSYHVKTTLCHDITTYDISIYRGSPTLDLSQRNNVPLASPQNQHIFNSHLNYLNLKTVWVLNIELSSAPPHVTSIPPSLLLPFQLSPTPPHSPTPSLRYGASTPRVMM